MHKRFSFITLVVAIAVAVVAAGALAAGITVDRGLPTANLNNAAGSDRSNVAWSLGSGDVTGDSFTVGTTGHTYSLDSITTWNIGHFGVPFNTEFSNVKLYIAGSDGALSAVPATFHETPVKYGDGEDYQAQDGSFRQLYADTFSGMNVTLNGGETYYFAVDGDSSTYDWFNHASNAALSGSAQDGADGLYYAWDKSDLSTAHACDSGAPDPGGVTFCDGGYSSSTDINVEIASSEIITPQTFAQVDRVTACASQPVTRVADGSSGLFIDLDQGTFDAGSYKGVTFKPSLFVQGVGATCEVPAGYTYAGYGVDGGGSRTGNADNIHPYYTNS